MRICWIISDTTDKLGYVGYENCCDVINKHFSQYRDSIEILDVGAGTGLLGARVSIMVSAGMEYHCFFRDNPNQVSSVCKISDKMK